MTRSLAALLNQSPEFADVRPQESLRAFNDAELFGDPFLQPAVAQAVQRLTVSPAWVVLELSRVESVRSPR